MMRLTGVAGILSPMLPSNQGSKAEILMAPDDQNSRHWMRAWPGVAMLLALALSAIGCKGGELLPPSLCATENFCYDSTNCAGGGECIAGCCNGYVNCLEDAHCNTEASECCRKGQCTTLCDPCLDMACNTPPSPCYNPQGSCIREPEAHCEYGKRANGTACEDGKYCNGSEKCQDGNCLPGTQVDCSALTVGPCKPGACNEESDKCVTNTLADGAGCDDGNRCTTPDSCLAGSCQAGPRICEQKVVLLGYLAGDNNLDPALDQDIDEMKAAKLDSVTWLKVYILVDRSADDPAWTDTRLYEVRKGSLLELAGTKLGLTVGGKEELNMADPNTLRNFILDVKAIVNDESYDYYLDLWDHGTGWQLLSRNPTDRGLSRACCADDTSGQAMLFNKDIRTATQGMGLKLIGFDACVMGMAEVAYEFRGVADVLVASEELTPGDGWSYKVLLDNFMASAEADRTPQVFGRLAADSFMAAYPSDNSLTISVYDLSKAQELATAADAVANALKSVSAGTWQSICGQAEWFGQVPSAGIRMPNADLPRLMESAASFDSANASIYQALQNLITSKMVLYEKHRAGHPNAHGMAVFFPCDPSWAEFDAMYSPTYIQWAQDTQWDEMLQAHN